MKADAKTHAEEDKKKKEGVDVHNLADSIIHTAEKAMIEAGDKIGDDIKKPIQEKIEALKAVKDGEDLEKIKNATEELGKEMQKIGEAMAKASGEAERPGGGESAGPDASAEGNPAQPEQPAKEGAPKDAEPVEGEYEEVKK